MGEPEPDVENLTDSKHMFTQGERDQRVFKLVHRCRCLGYNVSEPSRRVAQPF